MNHLDFDEDPKLIAVCLEGIHNILTRGEELIAKRGENTFLKIFEACGGTAKIEALQVHPSDEVHGNALVILEEFYEVESYL